MGSNLVQGDYFVLGKPVKPRRRAAVILAAAVFAALAFIPTAAFAEKGGNGKGIGHQQTADPACSVSPSTVSVGGTFTISASGLPANAALNVDELYPSFVRIWGAGSDGSGQVSVTDTAMEAGNVSVMIVDVSGDRSAVVSSCSFQVT